MTTSPVIYHVSVLSARVGIDVPLNGKDFTLPAGTFIPRFERSHVWLVAAVAFIPPLGGGKYWKMLVQLYRVGEHGNIIPHYLWPIPFVPSRKPGECESFMSAIGVTDYAAVRDVKKFEPALNAMLAVDRPHVRYSFRESFDSKGFKVRDHRFQAYTDSPRVPDGVRGFSEQSLGTINSLKGGHHGQKRSEGTSAGKETHVEDFGVSDAG